VTEHKEAYPDRPKEMERPLVPKGSRLKEVWLLFRRNRLAFVGLVIFCLFFLLAFAGRILTYGTKPVFNPAQVRLQEKLRPPLSLPKLETLRTDEVPRLGRYLFGTDHLGRDVLARMMQGAWVSLTVGFVSVGIAVVIGIVLGGVAGYFGQHLVRVDQILCGLLVLLGLGLLGAGNALWGTILGLGGILTIALTRKKGRKRGGPSRPWWVRFFFAGFLSVDTLIMRLVDIMLCFPSFFLILTVVALLPPSIYNIMIVIGLTSWEGTARFVRAEFLSLRELDFVTAARALGVSNGRIIFRHMIPNAVGPVLVSATIGIATAILTEAGLSFLGLGVPPPDATWGNILADGKDYIFDAPWLTFVPGVAILLVVLSFNLFGEGLRDILNPKLRRRS